MLRTTIRSVLRWTLAVSTALACGSAAARAQGLSFSYESGTERKVLDAQALTRATYSYAPTYIWTGRRLLSWSCVTSSTGAGDAVALTYSDDQISWSAPGVVFQERVANPAYSPFACDPAVVIVTPPGETQQFYYLYYGGSLASGGFIAVARSPVNNPAGFKKWVGGDPRVASSWRAEITTAPRIVIGPQRPCGSGGGTSSCYGAGQPTVVYRDGRFHMWYTDTTAVPMGIWYTTSADGLSFAPPVATNVQGGGAASVDVKLDAASGAYYMFELAGHGQVASLYTRTSQDGINWTAQTQIGTAPAWSHNVGVTGSPYGHLDRARPFYIGFGSPNDLRSDYDNACMNCPLRGWGFWDQYMGLAQVSGGGITPPPPPPPPPPPRLTKPVHRYFSGSHHFFTTDKPEGDRTGWRYEGVAFHVGSQQLSNSLELMRCRLRGNGLHFLSTQRDCEGQIVEAPIGWVFWSAAPGAREIVRCNRSTAFLATTNRGECAAAGYTINGPLGWAPPADLR